MVPETKPKHSLSFRTSTSTSKSPKQYQLSISHLAVLTTILSTSPLPPTPPATTSQAHSISFQLKQDFLSTTGQLSPINSVGNGMEPPLKTTSQPPPHPSQFSLVILPPTAAAQKTTPSISTLPSATTLQLAVIPPLSQLHPPTSIITTTLQQLSSSQLFPPPPASSPLQIPSHRLVLTWRLQSQSLEKALRSSVVMEEPTQLAAPSTQPNHLPSSSHLPPPKMPLLPPPSRWKDGRRIG